MDRRAVLAILLAVIASELVLPAYAHSTLGNLNGTSPFFRSNDHELNPTNTFGTAHVPGPLGYVWPGGGYNFYTGSGGFPGYQSPFENYEQPLQVAGNSYSPEGAILTSSPRQDSVGDLIFAINFSQPKAFITSTNPSPEFQYNNITIYVPAPLVDRQGQLMQDGFEPVGGVNWDIGDTSNIITTLTADYGKILVGRADLNDPFAPGWWSIRITSSGSGIAFTPERQWREWYYIRFNQLRAPDISGRYFFKVFLGGHYPVKHQSTPLVNSTMPVENWPVLLVKGEVDPAIIYGTVRYGEGSNRALYGNPIKLPGMVRAVGFATDPYTGDPTNRKVEARGYFNGSAEGHFEIEGVAAGIYDLYASAAGMPERVVAIGIKLSRGQSYGTDLSLSPGPEIRGEVFSKNCSGHIPWRSDLPISLVVYDSDDYVENNTASYSPINLTHAPYTSYVLGNTIFGSAKLAPPNAPKLVAFPWEGPVSYYPYTAAPPFRDPYGVHNGVGPAQVWWVSPTGTFDPVTGLGSSSSSFSFQFGSQRYYGAPRRLSGMVPQTFSTWIDGLGAGTYFVRAYVNGYIQTDVSGSRFQDYYFTVIDQQTISVDLYIDLWLSGTLNLTVHFHDTAGNMQTQPIGGPDPGRFLVAEAVDSVGTLAAFNFTYVPASLRSASLALNGLGMAGVIPPPDPRSGIKYSLHRYRGLRDYGIYPGSYFVHLYMRGYIQTSASANEMRELDEPVTFSLPSCGAVASVSTHMFRGAGINVTVYSMDWQDPPSQSLWRWNDAPVTVLVYDVASRSFADVISFWDSVNYFWSTPRQNSSYSTLPWPTWKDVFGPDSTGLITNGSTLLERLGPDLPSPTSLYPEQDIASNVFFQSSLGLGFLYRSQFYRPFGWRSSLAIYPGQYAITGWTYGYVQDGVVVSGDLGKSRVAAGMGQIADTSIRLVQGVEFNVNVAFMKEGLPSALPSNMSMRIRIYDDRDRLVAAASTSYDYGVIDPTSNTGFFADGAKVANAGGATSPIPAGTLGVEYRRLAGLFVYVDPIDGSQALQRLTQFLADDGVWGDSSSPMSGVYSGNWQVLVEMVPWYRPGEFYPPVPGLLQGEVHQTTLSILLPYNHLGPYESRIPVVVPNAHLGGHASVSVDLDLRGMVTGTVTFRNMHGDLRSASWASILLQGENKYTLYSWDGFYEGYLPPGAYTVTVQDPGLSSQNASIIVPDGGSVASSFYLNPSGIPIPEYSDYAILVLLTTGVSTSLMVTALSRKRKVKQDLRKRTGP